MPHLLTKHSPAQTVEVLKTDAVTQVGQVILSLPHSLSQTGMVAGIVLELLFASLAMWTVYLMTLLYLDHKNRKVYA